MNYNLELTKEQVDYICEQLKSKPAVYNDLFPVLDTIAAQIGRQNFIRQQEELQEAAREAGVKLEKPE